MLCTTRAITFQVTPYTDSKFIIKLYTEQFGLQSFMLNKSGKNKKSFNVFSPLSLTEVVIYKKEKSTIHSIKEVKTDFPFHSISSDIVKLSIVMFMNEVLLKSIREQEENSTLFNYIRNSLIELEENSDVVNFHVYFLAELTKYLGFYPQGSYSEETPYFDVKEGVFSSTTQSDFMVTEKNISQKLSLAFSQEKIILNGDERKKILDYLILYFDLHLQGLGIIKSRNILEEVLKN